MRRPLSILSATALAGLSTLTAGTAEAAVGGPDAAGYTFFDQDDGSAFAYFDISATGTLLASGDDVTGTVALPVPFEFYGVTYNDLAVSSNGFITDLPGATSDFSNDCPLPAVPSSGAGSFRIAALHDDLVTSVYYQFIDEATAAALGFPNQVDGVSVFQWQGTHFGAGGGPVDVEIALSHTFGNILSIVQQDADGGSGSTMGIQDSSGAVGLNYGCDTVGYTIPGVTSVTYIAPPVIRINEVRIDQTGTDNDEYFELAGPPGASLDGLRYLVLGDGPTGTIEAVINLDGQVIPPSGFFVVGEATLTLGVPNLVTTLDFENTDTVTHMLVSGFTGALNDNVDGNADGVFDVTPWAIVLDTVAVFDPGSAELPYGPPLACVDGPTCQEVGDGINAPQHVFRCVDTEGTWNIGQDDLAAVPATDSPGAANPCACGDGILTIPEECDDSGESAACDDDCTFAACGDGLVNMTALEECDDSGESGACDLDCTLAVCGDGTINMTAGEACDDMGESVTCNADCSVAACGDGVTNVAAGEECDDSGESATCNADCTMAVCGDSIVNNTAGETCDDGGRSAACNADCTSASCGDGLVNMTAGEECDGDGMGVPGETGTCDDDCTTAMCGDGVVNASAGEDCDDVAGETDVCDADCTVVECGDTVLNTSAGEECDDGNTEDGDGCAADCTEEVVTGTTGGDESTGGAETGGADSTGGDSTGGAGSSGGGGITTGPGVTTMPGGDSSGGDTDTDTEGGGAADPDSGCGCTTGGDERGTGWLLLTLFGLFGFRRRQR
jgi:MYXO-CTERM domain-containing protein